MDDKEEAGWPEWQSPETASRYIDVPTTTLSDWRVRGVGPTFSKMGPRLVRYRRGDLDDYMKARAQ
jgi:hypothetical protein